MSSIGAFFRSLFLRFLELFPELFPLHLLYLGLQALYAFLPFAHLP